MTDDVRPEKKRGRPRKNGSKSINQREEISAAALDLFTTKGYAATSMSAIARAAGLDQSSLYYWFKNKEAILRSLVESNRVSLELAGTIGPLPGNKAEQLYAVLYADALMLASIPFDYYLFEQASESQPESFEQFNRNYLDLLNWVERIITEGVKDGVLQTEDPYTEAVLALASNEGLQHRIHSAGPTKHSKTNTDIQPEIAADASASGTVARLLTQGSITEIRKNARNLGWIK